VISIVLFLPWQHIRGESAICGSLLEDNGGAMLVMFLGLTSLIVVMYTVTAKEFVVPATVGNTTAESKFHPRPVPVVPSLEPWFETVSKAFRESLQLVLRQGSTLRQHAAGHLPHGLTTTTFLWAPCVRRKRWEAFYDHLIGFRQNRYRRPM
jgi:hypothetical protein